MSDNDKMREGFEHYVATKTLLSLEKYATSGSYKYSSTQQAWETWQAAQAELEAERVPDAFDLGFQWRAALDGHVHDARDVARTLTCDFWPDSIKAARIQPDMTKGKVEAITFAKAEIKRLLAAATQPNKEGGG